MRTKTISIIVPAYNEAGSISTVLETLATTDFGLNVELLVIDDGSSDETALRCEEALDRLYFAGGSRLIRLPTNQGKGTAVKRGFAESTGDFAIVQDADLEYDPTEIQRLLMPVLAGRADVVIGSRFMGGHPRRVVYLQNALGNRLMSLLFSFVSGMKLSDIHSCYMLFDGSLIRQIEPLLVSRRWGFNPEVCSILADWRADLRIVESGISYYGRSKSEGKKIRLRHGIVAVAEILKFNLRRRIAFPESLSRYPASKF